MKHLRQAVTTAALLAVVCSGALAQLYTGPGGGNGQGNNGNGNGNTGTPPGQAKKDASPSQQNPDPFGLTLAITGAVSAAGYVVRRKREVS